MKNKNGSKKRNMKKGIIWFVLIMILTSISTTIFAEESREYTMLEHPFMLANQTRLSKLSRLGSEEPWKSMKEKAITLAGSTTFNPGADYEKRCDAVRFIASYNCTAFILDPPNADGYKDRILEAISYFDPSHENTLYNEIYTTDGDNWNGSVPPANTFATCVVALDIIYPELTEAEILAAESALESAATKFWNAMERHYQNTWGLRGLWAAYKQDYTKLKQCYDEWLISFEDNFAPDGGQLSSNEYNYWRHASSQRTAKILLPFVTEYMGFTEGFFENEKYKNAMEYTLGYTSTPTGQWWLFGDSMLGGAYAPEEVLGAYFASKFSKTAAEYGSFMVGDNYGAGEVLKLLLGRDDGTVAEPVAPESRIFPETAAFLYEDYNYIDSLAGVLYSSTQYSRYNGHKHKESNSIGLYAYGSMIMANSGYNFFGKAIDGYSWDYIQMRAISGNTVLINYEPGDIKNPSSINDHTYLYTDDYTNGITNGILNNLFSFARANSGQALPNGVHERTLALVSSQDNVPGYFVMFDDVTTDNSGDVVTVVHRPLSDTYTTVSEKEEYDYKVDYEFGKDVDLSLFMVNKPDEVEFVDGVVAGQASTGKQKHIKSLLAKYEVGDDKHLRAATIIFPSNETNKKPEITSLDIEGAYGAKLDFGDDIRDFVFTSKSGEHTYYLSGSNDALSHSYDRLTFNGRNVIIRKIKGVNASMFAEDAQLLKAGDEGFSSKLPLNIFVKNMKGNVEAESATEVTFYQYGIEKILYNGEALENIDAKSGSVTVVIPEGVGEIELICDKDNSILQMLYSSVSGGFFKRTTAFNLLGNTAIVRNGIVNTGLVMIEEKAYIPYSLAVQVFGKIEFDNMISVSGCDYVSLRDYAETAGYHVQWHESGTVFVSQNGFDFETNLPNIGFTLRIFEIAYDTETITKNSEMRDSMTFLFENDNEVRTIINSATPKNDITVIASDEPEAQNPKEHAIDGDLSTRWSAQGRQWIVFDFGDERTVEQMYLAWFSGHTRYEKFIVQISSDNQNWNTVYTGRNSGTTELLESVDTGEFTARYVKVLCGGTNTSPWNSLSEAEFIFKE